LLGDAHRELRGKVVRDLHGVRAVASEDSGRGGRADGA